ncbi:hypothetical protein E4P82_19380 [Candidatus Competibacter phosphatis]|uniref:ABC transmembrane type-1 domain-containing protein n=1 Tax=Candidatus Competibacter phosphatis TaxID=221280 RepID=A0ABX1TSW0_9GAMM|nr:ABC transporter permease subunit [Candidatus Competibacter phosphatis]NMQ21168.1 hypothetical protein [Candidatus Competibacter phosphatis]
MALKHRPATWPWYLLLAAILIGLVAGLWVATKRVHYEWRWERVPQYFAYRAEVPQESPIAGRVSAIQAVGALSRVVVTPADGGAPVVLPVETVQVAVGDTLDQEDSVGDNHEWRIGPLTQGLWVTIWISFVSGLVGLLIGLITGLCRISDNPVLRGLAVIYIELIRGTPLLVQIFIFYFFIGTVLNLDRIVAGIGALVPHPT